MAITTLPYPNLDFVPLDVLTAEELNQMMSNIKAINNATIGTSSLADNSITTSKIDWTTFARIKTLSEIRFTTSTAWTRTDVGDEIVISGLTPNTGCAVMMNIGFVDNGVNGEYGFHDLITNTYSVAYFGAIDVFLGGTVSGQAITNAKGELHLKRTFTGGVWSNKRFGNTSFIAIACGVTKA